MGRLGRFVVENKWVVDSRRQTVLQGIRAPPHGFLWADAKGHHQYGNQLRQFMAACIRNLSIK